MRRRTVFLFLLCFFIPSLLLIHQPWPAGGTVAATGHIKVPSSASHIVDAAGLGNLTQVSVSRLAGALPAGGRPPAPGSPAGDPAPVWDEQVALTFTQSFLSMAWNVTAVPQNDSYGYGPAYLLNGLTDKGWWYQVGVSFDWPYSTGGFAAGFNMNYEVFSPNGSSVFPASGGGLIPFSGAVYPYDTIELTLSFSGSRVIMSAYDWGTGARASVSYAAFGSLFVGSDLGGYAAANSNGFFTGLMTEEYHVDQYTGDEKPVPYYALGFQLQSAWVSADEYDPYSNSVLFAGTEYFSAGGSSKPYFFSTGGVTQAVSGFYAGLGGALYVTGGAGIISAASGLGIVRASYTVADGGQPPEPPVFTVSEGGTIVFDLRPTPTIYAVPGGATWSALDEYPAPGERYAALSPGGTLPQGYMRISVIYYKQYQVGFYYNVEGGGQVSPPIVEYTQFGVMESVGAGVTVWADAGSVYSYASQLPGSNSMERWVAENMTGNVEGAGTVTVVYYHQYQVWFNFTVTGGGSGYSPPQVFYVGFGSNRTTVADTSVWVDAGTTYAYQYLLHGSGVYERWVAGGSREGTVTGAAGIDVHYYHQFYVEFTVNDPEGGEVGDMSGWYDAYSTVSLRASPGNGWILHGWVGSGDGSYTGAPGGVIDVDGPINESAVFYVGLTLSVTGSGSVSYASGSVNGLVGGGHENTVYISPGSVVEVSISPAFLYSFSGWSGSVTSNSKSLALTVNSPMTLQANFTVDYPAVVLVIAAPTAVAAASYMLKVGRRTGREAKPI